MKKLLVLLLFICFLVVGCNVSPNSDSSNSGGETVVPGDSSTDDESIPDDWVSINLAPNGDFNSFTVGSECKSYGWGSSGAKIVENGKDGKGVELSNSGFVFYNTLCTFKESNVVATADIKLTDGGDSEKVKLLVEFVGWVDGKEELITGGSFESVAAASSEWQEVKLSIPLSKVKEFNARKVTVKVVNYSDNSILVDNIKLNAGNDKAVNFLAYGTFSGNLDGKWKLVKNSEWTDPVPVEIDEKNAVKLDYDVSELISSNAWLGDNGIKYNTTKDGELSFSAKGKGDVQITIEKKNNDSDVKCVEENVSITDEWAVYSVTIPKMESEYKETTVKFKTSTGTGSVYITDVLLHYKEGE